MSAAVYTIALGTLAAIFEFHGGVGVYPWGIHLDTRGLNHSWDAT